MIFPGLEGGYHLQTQVWRRRPWRRPKSGQWRFDHGGFETQSIDWNFLKQMGLLLPSFTHGKGWEVSKLEVGRVLSLGWRRVAIVLRIHYNFYTSFLRYQGSNNKLQCQGRSGTRSRFIPVAPWIKTCHSFVQSFPASVRMASFDSTLYLLEKCFPYCQRFWKYTL